MESRHSEIPKTCGLIVRWLTCLVLETKKAQDLAKRQSKMIDTFIAHSPFITSKEVSLSDA
jgi:hypothetical protein